MQRRLVVVSERGFPWMGFPRGAAKLVIVRQAGARNRPVQCVANAAMGEPQRVALAHQHAFCNRCLDALQEQLRRVVIQQHQQRPERERAGEHRGGLQQQDHIVGEQFEPVLNQRGEGFRPGGLVQRRPVAVPRLGRSRRRAPQQALGNQQAQDEPLGERAASPALDHPAPQPQGQARLLAVARAGAVPPQQTGQVGPGPLPVERWQLHPVHVFAMAAVARQGCEQPTGGRRLRGGSGDHQDGSVVQSMRQHAQPFPAVRIGPLELAQPKHQRKAGLGQRPEHLAQCVQDTQVLAAYRQGSHIGRIGQQGFHGWQQGRQHGGTLAHLPVQAIENIAPAQVGQRLPLQQQRREQSDGQGIGRAPFPLRGSGPQQQSLRGLDMPQQRLDQAALAGSVLAAKPHQASLPRCRARQQRSQNLLRGIPALQFRAGGEGIDTIPSAQWRAIGLVPGFQIRQQTLGGLIAIAGLFFHQSAEDGFEAGRDARVELAGPGRLRQDVLVVHLPRCAGGEGKLAGKDQVRQRAEGVQIRALVRHQAQPGRLLGGAAGQRVRLPVREIRAAQQSPRRVRQHAVRLVRLARDEQIGGLQVQVQHAGTVQCRQSHCRLPQKRDPFGEREGPGPQRFGQRLGGIIGEYLIGNAFALNCPNGAQQMRMIDRLQQPHGPPVTQPILTLQARVGRKDFNRQHLAAALVRGQIQRAGRGTAEELFQTIAVIEGGAQHGRPWPKGGERIRGFGKGPALLSFTRTAVF